MDYPIRVKERIFRHKEETGKTDSDIAKAIGISTSSFYNKLNGLTEWKFPSEIMALCGLLNCTAEDLID